MADEERQDGEKGARQKMGDGIRSGIGILSALKDALDESIQEARERGDLSAERAKELVKDALEKAQTAASGARERLDFATHGELGSLEGVVEAMKGRVAALETAVFGEERQAAKDEEDSQTT
jgi:polyhydroxyalkanoate synthesis regulator phasin